MKILYVGDLHINLGDKNNRERSKLILKRAEQADLVVFCGDISDAGRSEEYACFMELYSSIKEKSILVRGNHDMGEYMRTLESWFPKDLEIHFQRGEYPVWIWKANRFEMLQANTKCFALQKNLPEPYHRMAQPPVIVVYDGVGPYFYYEKAGVRFIVLDGATHQLGEQQQEWLKQTIDSSCLPVILQLHEHILPGGSHVDGAQPLWDSAPLLDQFVHNEKVIGIFAAHLHFNSAWDWNGKKIVQTGSRGESRFVEVENGKIISIEPLDNRRCLEGIPEQYKGMFDVTPLDLRYWMHDGDLAENTFVVRGYSGFWGDLVTSRNNWGWHNPDGDGGLIWSLPPELLPEKEIWFSVNFRSTTSWELVLENNGKEEIVSRGDAGENLIATGSFGKGPIRPFRRVILRQKAPALGHASGFMALHETPVPEFRPYC